MNYARQVQAFCLAMGWPPPTPEEAETAARVTALHWWGDPDRAPHPWIVAAIWTQT